MAYITGELHVHPEDSLPAQLEKPPDKRLLFDSIPFYSTGTVCTYKYLLDFASSYISLANCIQLITNSHAWTLKISLHDSDGFTTYTGPKYFSKF